MDPVKIVIDVTDWAEEALHAEAVPETRDDVGSMALRKGIGARKAAQRALALRAANHSPQDVMPSDKDVLSDGGLLVVTSIIRNRKEQIERNGRIMEMRAYTAVVQDEDEQPMLPGDDDVLLPEHEYVAAGTPESVENAKRLLMQYVPGHIRNRCAEIWAGGGDARAAWEEVRAVCDAIVDEIAG